MSEQNTGAESPPKESGEDSAQYAEKKIDHPFSKYLPDMNPADFPKVHPHADIFPMISIEEIQDMAEDIKANGLKHEIAVMHILNDFGQDELWILEGRNRWVACTIAGVTPRFIDETLTMTNSKSVSATLDYVISENLHRRHLSGTQRDVIAERLATARRGGKQNGEFTAEQAAKQLKRSVSSLHKVRKLKEKAPRFYDALVRGKYKNVDAAWKASGLGTRPEKVFIIRMQYGVRRIMHEEVSPGNQNNLYAFKTKAEAETKLTELLASDEAERKSQAEANQRKAEAEAQAKAEAARLQAEAQKEKQSDTNQSEQQEQSEPTQSEPSQSEDMVDLTSLNQQKLVNLAERAVYPEAAPLPSNKTMVDFINALKSRDARSSEFMDTESFRTIEDLLKYAAGAKKKRLLDERIVYWLKLMGVKFTARLLRNRQGWIKSMLNLNYTETK
jgi:hypothetical protein